MRVLETPIRDAYILEPNIFKDDRGYFYESFRLEQFNKYFEGINFVQDNVSVSKKNVLRGLHFQKEYPQGKLIQVLEGSIIDVIVDLRENSDSYGQYYSAELTSNNKLQLWAPPGLAHGFYVTSNSAKVLYKCTDYYHPEDDYCLLWCDPEVGIEWPTKEPILSKKDNQGLLFESIKALNV